MIWIKQAKQQQQYLEMDQQMMYLLFQLHQVWIYGYTLNQQQFGIFGDGQHQQLLQQFQTHNNNNNIS